MRCTTIEPAPAEGAPSCPCAALPLAFEPVAGGLLIVVIAVGLAAIGAWLRSALRSAEPPAEPAPARPTLVPPPPTSASARR